MQLRHVILDFDGTSTLVEQTQAQYLDRYRELLHEEVGAEFASLWDEGWERVRTRSPEAAWCALARTPSAPANADPYIAAGEIVGWIERRWKASGRAVPAVPRDLYKRAYAEAEAPWRDEIVSVLKEVTATGARVTFVSNSATSTIAERLDALLAGEPELRASLRVFGDANKYVVKELSWDGAPLPEACEAMFQGLDAAATVEGLLRPVYLRRGDYFHALCKVWDDDASAASATLVCGDIYELDLAMPARLGCHIHMITRAAPHGTCDYERAAVAAVGARGGVSDDLHGLIGRVKAFEMMAHV